MIPRELPAQVQHYVEAYLTILNSHTTQVGSVTLFGSWTSEAPRAPSDMDVIITSLPGKGIDLHFRKALQATLAQCQEHIPYPISAVPYEFDKLCKAIGPLGMRLYEQHACTVQGIDVVPLFRNYMQMHYSPLEVRRSALRSLYFFVQDLRQSYCAPGRLDNSAANYKLIVTSFKTLRTACWVADIEDRYLNDKLAIVGQAHELFSHIPGASSCINTLWKIIQDRNCIVSSDVVDTIVTFAESVADDSYQRFCDIASERGLWFDMSW